MDWSRGGADEAERLVGEHYADVLRYCRRRTTCVEDAQDAAQETFLRFMRSAQSYRERGKPLAYLLTIARNVCIDLSRAHARDPEELPEDLASPDAPDGRDLDLERALGRLRPEEREVLELRFDQGLRVGEVGQVLDMSRFAAARRVRSALDALRAELAGDASPERMTAQGAPKPTERGTSR